MNATFKTDAGTEFRISISEPQPITPDSIPGNVDLVTVLFPKSVLLTVAFDEANAIQAHLRKSEARAIASALMGAAAEL